MALHVHVEKLLNSIFSIWKKSFWRMVSSSIVAGDHRKCDMHIALSVIAIWYHKWHDGLELEKLKPSLLIPQLDCLVCQSAPDFKCCSGWVVPPCTFVLWVKFGWKCIFFCIQLKKTKAGEGQWINCWRPLLPKPAAWLGWARGIKKNWILDGFPLGRIHGYISVLETLVRAQFREWKIFLAPTTG